MVKYLQVLFNFFTFSIAGVRAVFWKIFVKEMGCNVMILGGCSLQSPSGIELGNNIIINHNTTIAGHGGLIIGDYVQIGPNCNILTASHGYSEWKIPIRNQPIIRKKVIIEDDVWIGANVVVLPGVKIGRGSIVGANAVVTKNVEPFTIVGGVPAKKIKDRFRQDIKKKASKYNLSNYGIEIKQ